MISINAPAGYKPAKRAKSTAASVCPDLRNTPLERARRGFTCPGRPKSDGFVFGSANARIVSARSNIETPVVHPPPNLSTVMVKGVSCIDVLFVTCMFRSNSSHRSSVIGAHNTPRPCVSMKLTFSGVIFSAAMMKSPSFSRSSSSTTIINFPSRKSSIASSIVFSFISFIIFVFNIPDEQTPEWVNSKKGNS